MGTADLRLERRISACAEAVRTSVPGPGKLANCPSTPGRLPCYFTQWRTTNNKKIRGCCTDQ